MYNFIFWFFYTFFDKKKGFTSPFLSASMVGLALLIHAGVLQAIIRYSTGFRIGTFSKDYTTNKLMAAPIIILIFLITYLAYYRPRTEKILNKYKDKKPFTWQNILLVILIMVVPLVFAAIVTNMAVAKFKALHAFMSL